VADCPFCQQTMAHSRPPAPEAVRSAMTAFMADVKAGKDTTCPFCAQSMTGQQVAQALQRMSSAMDGPGPIRSGSPHAPEGAMADSVGGARHPDLPDLPRSRGPTSSSGSEQSRSSWWQYLGCLVPILIIVLSVFGGRIGGCRDRNRQEAPPESGVHEARSEPAAQSPGQAATAPTEAGASVDSLIERALAAKAAGQLAEAEKALRSALQVDPASVRARLALAWTLVALDRRQDAKAEFQAVVDSAPSGPERNEAIAALGRIE
jgi:TolA-binding protein